MDYKNIDNMILNLNKKVVSLNKHKKVILYNEKQLDKINNLLKGKKIIMDGGKYNEYAVKVNEGLIVLNEFEYLMYNVQLLEMYKTYNKLRDKLYDIMIESLNKLDEQIPSEPSVTIELLDIILKKMGSLFVSIYKTKDQINAIGPSRYVDGQSTYYKDKKENIDELLTTIREEINKEEIKIESYVSKQNIEKEEILQEISELESSITAKSNEIQQLTSAIDNAKVGKTLR